MDDDEFEALLGAVPTLGDAKHLHSGMASEITPDAVDWRHSNLMTRVRDQGDCAAGWAFATADAASASFAKEHGQLLTFSAQELIDCTHTRKFKNNACDGGSVMNVLEHWYMKRHYMTQDENYEYTGEKGTCDFDGRKTTGIYVQDYVRLQPDSIHQMKNWVSQQPLTVAMNASHLGFRAYSRGIFDPEHCDTTANHFALLVGYGTDKYEGDYWIVKNSWGEDWGEDGFAKIAIKDGAGVCGIQKEVIGIRAKCENEAFCGDIHFWSEDDEETEE